MKEWRCKHCRHHIACSIGDKVYIYCTKEHNYPSPRFIEAWGCGGYEKESEQLNLFDIVEKEDKE